jgi:pantetheine-phosphate adenylyltransferase
MKIQKVALYPGTFSPIHKGHADVIRKALKVFDLVAVTRLHNTSKSRIPTNLIRTADWAAYTHMVLRDWHNLPEAVEIGHNEWSPGYFLEDCEDTILLADYIKQFHPDRFAALLRGLRNGHDLQYEMNLQYWNEDLGMTLPVFYVICDRTLAHVSSSAIKEVAAIRYHELCDFPTDFRV